MKNKKFPDTRKTDVLIVGGGLAGLTLASLLGQDGVRVICLDRDPPLKQLEAAFDGRTTAISFGSRQILEQAGVWPQLERMGNGACPIATIQILEGARNDVPLTFDHAEVSGRMFGWIVENRDFRRCLQDRVAALPSVRHLAPVTVTGFERSDDSVRVEAVDESYEARLVIGADGRHSLTREWLGIGNRAWDYGQQAVVCTVFHDQPHRNSAVEHFRAEGPFAILPMADDAQGRHRSSVVWTIDKGNRRSPMDWPQAAFDAGLTARFPAGYGSVRQAGARFAYPLGLTHAHAYIGPRMALIAEAAHAIHPIAGQGLNLGFRDVAALAKMVGDACRNGQDPGAQSLLESYQRQRRLDNMAMAGATDSLNRLFSNGLPAVALARRMGLDAVARLPVAKRFFMNQAMGASSLLQGMIRDRAA